ncbi:MAG: TetR family transcriptional regulator [Actinobacteria bacterium]|nr:TetR family transcriptional regulator [Actinomycetota bacterium]
MRERPRPEEKLLLGITNSDSSGRLLAAALQQFGEKGFHAATTRDISEGAEMSPAGVYVRYASKVELLFELTKISHEIALSQVRQALDDAPPRPAERVRLFVEAFARYHVEHPLLARVSQYELTALPAERFKEVNKIRRNVEKLLRAELEAGVASGDFEVPNVKGVSTAILSLCIDIARWSLSQSRDQNGDITNLYGDLALKMISA